MDFKDLTFCALGRCTLAFTLFCSYRLAGWAPVYTPNSFHHAQSVFPANLQRLGLYPYSQHGVPHIVGNW